MKYLYKLTITFFSLSLFFTAGSLFAAEIRVDTNTSETTTNEQVLVDVILHTEEPVNAIEGTLSFSPDLLSFVEIRDGNSSVNFWIEKPHEASPGNIMFSGITPGGFRGANQYIFSVVFEAKSMGLAELFLVDIRALKHDGAGTPIDLSTHGTTISIKEGDKNVNKEVLVDMDIPEDFIVSVETSEHIFNGKYFLVFATQDKISGIDHYEVSEGTYGRFRTAVSPYLLKHQSLNKKIVVKAIDREGNERMVVLNPQNRGPWYETYVLFAILLIGMLFLGFFLKKLCPKFIK